MAESQVIAKQALDKLEDQLTCAICLDAFKDPKLLQCFHVYCKDCLQRLVVQDQLGQLSVRCPTCRQSTLLPQKTTDVSGLQSAFHIQHLLEIQNTLEKLKEPNKVKCEKCNKDRSATSYCRDCGKFICDACVTVHGDWDEYVGHEIVTLEQLESKAKQVNALKKVTLFCSLHQGKELDLYCETCEELICLLCTVKKHKEHQYDLVGDTFEMHKAEITASLEPVTKQLSAVTKAIEQLDLRSRELTDQQAAVEAIIQQEIQQLIDVLLARKAELIGQLQQHFKMKMENITAQKTELEMIQTQLASCLSFVKASLKTDNKWETMRMKKRVSKRIRQMTDNFKPDMLPPCEPANIKFISSPLPQASQLWQFGKVFLQQILCPEKCYATGKGLEVTEPGERTTVVVHVVDHQGKACSTPVEKVTCELVCEKTGEKIDGSVKKTEASQYEISYQPTNQRRYQLHIKVEDEHIKGSPFAVTVRLPVQKLGTPINTIGRINRPWGVAVNKSGEIIVTEGSGHCVSIFTPTGGKILSFGSQGSAKGQFNNPRGVAVDGDGNIMVVDKDNHRIQKFSSDGKFITAVGKNGNEPLEFNHPVGIAIHPQNSKVYIADNHNHRIQILNPDLTLSSTFGSRGKGSGQFVSPWDVAFDSAGNVYVVACSNHCVHVFTAEGKYLKKFGKKGNGNGELNKPSGIAIGSDDVVYVADHGNHRVSVFTNDGKFLTLFGTEGRGPGQFDKPTQIAVGKNGVVCVSDTKNQCLQMF